MYLLFFSRREEPKYLQLSLSEQFVGFRAVDTALGTKIQILSDPAADVSASARHAENSSHQFLGGRFFRLRNPAAPALRARSTYGLSECIVKTITAAPFPEAFRLRNASKPLVS